MPTKVKMSGRLPNDLDSSRDGELSPGDILLFFGARGVGALISALTKSPYHHVALYTGSGELVEAMPSGVVQSTLESKRNQKKPFVVIPSPEKANALAAAEWAKSKIGDGYDPADLLAIALDRLFAHTRVYVERGDRFTCGEFVAMAFSETGYRLFPDIDPGDVIPGDFARFLKTSSKIGESAN